MPKHSRDPSEDRDRRGWRHDSRSLEREPKRSKNRRKRSRTPGQRDKSPSRNRRFRSPSISTTSTYRERSQSRERLHRRRSRSRSNERSSNRYPKVPEKSSRDNHQPNKSDIEKLSGALSNQIQLSPMIADDDLNEKILPEFDPESKRMSVDDWLTRVNHCADVRHWNNWQKLYLATLRLRGCARGWYEQVSVSDTPFLSWREFSMAIAEKFPFTKTVSFGESLEEMVQFTSDSSGMSIKAYYYEKVNRINRLNFEVSEEKIFDLVVHGISDADVRMKTCIYCREKSLAELDKFFDIFFGSDGRRKNEGGEEGSKRNGKNHLARNFRKPDRANGCFNCGEHGHKKRACPGLRRGNSQD
ncbi:uncharacterized protein [Fopius arisanus]|uniref:MIMI_L116 protein n=1 Tax=Fopius arisanus TaxID=64838 RepID=A0A0C9R4W6_9HYME|nr:PREDICTED: uncharacterized protein LOC105270053 [Fopius arisanus]